MLRHKVEAATENPLEMGVGCRKVEDLMPKRSRSVDGIERIESVECHE